MKRRFDSEAFAAAIYAAIYARRLNANQAAAQAGVSASTLTRMKQGKRPDVDSMAALAAWAGVSLDTFVTDAMPTDDVLVDLIARANQLVEQQIREAYRRARAGVHA